MNKGDMCEYLHEASEPPASIQATIHSAELRPNKWHHIPFRWISGASLELIKVTNSELIAQDNEYAA
jgi:hypothetical protein